jgi:hypothetical protein
VVNGDCGENVTTEQIVEDLTWLLCSRDWTPLDTGRLPVAIFGGGSPEEDSMDTTTILIIIIVVLIVGGGGWYGRGRWF